MAERRLSVSNRIAALLLAVLSMLLLLELLSPHLLKNITNLGKLIIYLVIFILPTALYVRLNRYSRKDALRLRFVKAKYLPFILLFGISVSVICALINAGVAALAKGLWDTRAAASTVGFSSGNPLMLALTMVIMPAVCEELLIRGVALYEYEKYGVTAAVIMTSLVFSLFHGSLLTAPALFVAGVCYAVTTLLFRSVWPAIICHCINNGLALYTSSHSDFIAYLSQDVIFVIIAAFVLFVILYLTLRLTENVIEELGDKKRLRTDRKKRAAGSPAGSVFIWLFFIVSITVSVLKLTGVL